MSRKPPVSMAPLADVCLLLEGTWPYVRGGVSSWVNQLILGLPDTTFSVVFIGGQRDAYPRRNYAIAPNVLHIEEVFIEEAWRPAQRSSRMGKGTPAQADLTALYDYFHNPDAPDDSEGQKLLDCLAENRLSLSDVLRSRASWEVLTEGYRTHCTDPSFIDFFWTLRTIQSPMIMLAEAAERMPRARVLHSISTGYAGLLGCILQRRWDCAYVLSEHGIYTKERKIDLAQAGWIAENKIETMRGSDPGKGYIRTLWIRFFERVGLLVYRSANPIVALYKGNRQRQMKDGADPIRTRIIRNGIDLDRWTAVLEGRPEGIAPVVGMIGRVVPIKDVKTFIRAVRGVVSAMPEAEGWIVGPEDEDPEYAAECRSLVSSLGLDDKVKFLGYQQIQDILPKLGVMVLTSISEAQPLVILEAWCAGTPVVSSDVGSCREMIEGGSIEDRELGNAGEVVPIADPQATTRAILDLLLDPPYWQSAQRSGLARVHRYYGEALMLASYRGLYQSAMENVEWLELDSSYEKSFHETPIPPRSRLISMPD